MKTETTYPPTKFTPVHTRMFGLSAKEARDKGTGQSITTQGVVKITRSFTAWPDATGKTIIQVTVLTEVRE